MLRQGETGDWIGTFEGHKGAVWGVDINKDATKAATGAADFSAKVWDAQSGTEELSLLHKHIVKSVHFSSDGAALATGSNDKILRIYDLEQPSEPIVKFEGHTAGIKQVSYTPDNSRLLSCSDDKTLRMWDTSTGNLIVKKEFPDPLGGLEISKDGSVITVAVGRKVVFLNTNTLDVEREVNVPCAVYTASLHNDKEIFVCGGEDLKLYKYNYNTGVEIDNFKGHFGPIHCVRFSPDGELYASGSEDGTLRLWQTEVGKTYGLWKCVDTVSSAVESKSEATVDR
jgi:serine-threonine kinase receptor-associated protein